jgi:D-alanyl-D-alanine dipeptidase
MLCALALAALSALAPAPATGLAAPAAPAVDRCEASYRPPATPPPSMTARVGQYGAPDDFIDVSEHCGALYATGGGLPDARLIHRGDGLYTVAGPAGESGRLMFAPGGRALTWRGRRLERHDFGAEAQFRIQAAVHADSDGLRRAALAAKPPAEPPSKRPSDLVAVRALDPTIRIHTLYAGRDNFLGVPIYEKAGAFLQRPAAEALARVQQRLRAQGYGLLITDAYRPWFATKMFWDATPDEDHIYVADPAQGSRHNRGCAVDLTLVDLKTGRAVEMTGRVDEMSKRSHADYAGGTSRQRWYRARLRLAMEAEGFAVYPYEWWHFDYKDWADYPIGTATFTELEAGRAH